MFDALRYAVLLLAALVSGGVLVVGVRYLVETWRNDRKSPGRILARHVSELAGGTLFLTLGFCWAMVAQLDGTTAGAEERLFMYLAGMILFVLGLLDVGRYQRKVRAGTITRR